VPRDQAVTGERTPRYRAYPLEFDDRGRPTYQPRLTAAHRRDPGSLAEGLNETR
jgi:hypothetical protein